MAKIRSTSEIIRDFLDFYRVAQPALDVKPGSSARDVLVDGPSTQLGVCYDELSKLKTNLSPVTSYGQNFENWAKNFGITKPTGKKATGFALLLFNNIETDIALRAGDLVYAKNGSSFIIKNSLVLTSTKESYYKSIVNKYKSDLDTLGFTEIYGIEVLVEATATGTQGNISRFSLKSTNITGINSITNVSPFSNGSSAASDASFKNYFMASFNGSVSGTSVGYTNKVKENSAVIDVVSVESGDDLMTRDGTIVSVAENGTRTIVSDGTGGKTDIIVLGATLQQGTDSYIYKDKSNQDDPTNSKNDYVLGQISGDENKTFNKKRKDNVKKGIVPNQPVYNLVSLSGSLSGSNFKEKTTDSLGRVSGNYELVKDTGSFADSVWGFDKIHFISNKISDLPEDKTKETFNGQDPLGYTDLLEVKKITQNIVITNENSQVQSTDKSYIQLNHFPVSSVTRVFNVTTGERYVVTSQNPDGSGELNETGRIKISGKSLPAVSDILQVDYVWNYSFDPYWDCDNIVFSDNYRDVTDSIDWGYSNLVRRELSVLSTSGSYLNASVTHNISSVIKVNVFSSEETTVTLVSNRKAIVLSNTISNIESVQKISNKSELWNTIKDDGTLSGLTAYLPSDTIAEVGDAVSVIYNATDVYGTTGTVSNNTINIVPSDYATAGTLVECTYLANINTLLPATSLSNLPVIRNNNQFTLNNLAVLGNQPTSHLYEDSIVVKNLRLAPSHLLLNLLGAVSTGVLTVTGTSIKKIENVVFTASKNGLTQDLSAAIKKSLGLTSIESISSNIKVCRLVKLEKIKASSASEYISTINSFDIKGYYLLDNTFTKNEAVYDVNLSKTQITLPSTENNIDNTISIGDKLLVTCYISEDSASENIYFSKSGSIYTNKKYLTIDSITISSGFNSSNALNSVLTISNFNQPLTKSRYKVYYDYLAPKTNERITINYNYNKLIGDSQLNLEKTIHLNDDILIKQCENILVDVTMKIVIDADSLNFSDTIIQNVKDAVTSKLNINVLNGIIDSSDLELVAGSISGVDRVRVTYFNKTGVAGSVLSIVANKKQSIFANNVSIIQESR